MNINKNNNSGSINNNISNLEFKQLNKNYIYNIPIENSKKLENQSTLIKKLKLELTQVLFDDKTREFKNENQVSYFNYLSTQICCCFTSEEKNKMFNFEINRIQKILSFETFQHYLTEAYAIQYKKFDSTKL